MPTFLGDPEKPDRAYPGAGTFSLAKGVAYYFTHPRFLRKVNGFLFPKGSDLNPVFIPKEKLQHFGPVQTLDFTSLDGKRLKGYWLPSEKPARTTVILGHGYIVNAGVFLPTGQRLCREGYNVFLFDYRGHGESEGEETSIGWHEGKDLAAAVDYVKDHFGGQAEKVFYMGHSMGAATLMLAPKSLAEHPEALARLEKRLDGIILDSPFHKISLTNHATVRVFNDYRPKGARREQLWDMLMASVRKTILKVGSAIYKASAPATGYDATDLRTSEVFAGSPLSRKPILHIHGKKDVITPFTHALKIRQTISPGNPHFRFLSMDTDHQNRQWRGLGDGINYTVVERGGEVYYENLLKFLKQPQSPPPASSPEIPRPQPSDTNPNV